MAPITSPKWVLLLPILLYFGGDISAAPAPVLAGKLAKLVHKLAKDDHKHDKDFGAKNHAFGGRFSGHHAGGFGGAHGLGFGDCGHQGAVGGGQAFAAATAGATATGATAEAIHGAVGGYGAPGNILYVYSFMSVTSM
jgi:hypothetical protein